MSDLNGVDLVK